MDSKKWVKSIQSASYIRTTKSSTKIQMIFYAENDFENQNFEFFEELVDNFGRSDDDLT